MVQNRGDIGLDKVVMKGEREEKEREEKEREGRFAINAKPNPYTTPITHHDTISPSPQNKSRNSRQEKKE